MKRTILALFLLLVIVLCIASCQSNHTHTYGEWWTSKSPTCTQEGEQSRMCPCGEIQVAPIARLEHTYSEWNIIKEATCAETGEKTRQCSCGDTQTQTIVQTSHTYSTWTVTKEPTCTETGIKTRSCTCGDMQNRAVAATGHTYSEWSLLTPPTCTETGEMAQTCSTCGDMQKKPEAALTHTWIDATCTAPKTCQNCGTTMGVAIGHRFTSTITVEPTCTQKGSKRFSCDGCGAFYIETIDLPTYTSSELYEYVAPSVAEIITYDRYGNEFSLGSGFVYASNGQIVTNYHVIENAYAADIKIGGRTYPVESVLAYDKDIDLAVLKINATDLPVVPTCDAPMKTGATVYAIGSSQGLSDTISNGIVSHASREIDGVVYIQHNASISAGNSGGPLLNAYGEIIGINTFTLRDSQNLNFAIFTSELDYLIFGNAITLPELFERESDPLLLLKNYIISYGDYDSSDNEYSLAIGSSYSSDHSSQYIRMAYYNASTDIVSLYFLIDAEYLVWIEIDQIDGVYDWGYYDDNDYLMTGVLYASTFNSDTLLGYSYNNIPTASLRNSVRDLASSMMNFLCLTIGTDLSDIGLTAYDLGFLEY